MKRYLRNVWYQAGWSGDLDGGAMLARTIIEIPILLFRDEAGAAVALLDRCPHRFAPLSTGRIIDGQAVCGYHGLGFDGAGRCVRNPHGPITTSMRVDSFPAVERHTGLWVWLGDPEKADPNLVPDLSFIDETPEKARITIYLPTAADYQLVVDNIMDLSHVDYLHPSSLGGIMSGVKAHQQVEDGKVTATWDTPDCDPPPAFRMMLPPGSRADIWTQVTWHAPGALVLGTSALPVGQVRTAADEAYTLHNAVPETATTSHYFVCSTRPFLQDDEGFSQMLGAALRHAFEHEDKPMLEKQQQRIGAHDLDTLNPLLLPTDAAAGRVRRLLAGMIAQEQAA